MKCIACGREMLDRITYYQCSNVLCDCIEEIEDREYWHTANTAVRDLPLTN